MARRTRKDLVSRELDRLLVGIETVQMREGTRMTATRAEILAHKLWWQSIEGDTTAAKIILDRVEGPVVPNDRDEDDDGSITIIDHSGGMLGERYPDLVRRTAQDALLIPHQTDPKSEPPVVDPEAGGVQQAGPPDPEVPLREPAPGTPRRARGRPERTVRRKGQPDGEGN